jgi:recombination protein RecA
MYGEGISMTGSILDMAANVDIVKKAGAWYSYNDMKLGQGRENSKQFLDENLELRAEIEAAVKSHFSIGDSVAVEENVEE